MYFCKTQIGISIKKATKFHIHKKSHVKKTDCKTIQKKNTIVKWNKIQTNQIKIHTKYKFLSFV